MTCGHAVPIANRGVGAGKVVVAIAAKTGAVDPLGVDVLLVGQTALDLPDTPFKVDGEVASDIAAAVFR